MNQDSRSKNILLDGIIVIVALVVAWNIYNGNVNKKKALTEEKRIEQEKNEVLQEIVTLEGKISSYKAQINKNVSDSSRIIGVINSLAQASGIKINSIRPEQKINKDFYSLEEYGLSFNIYDYHTLGKFISKLETSQDFFFVIDNVGLQEQSLGTTGDAVEILVQMRIGIIFIN